MDYMLLYYLGDEDRKQREDPATVGDYWGAWNAYVGALYASGKVVAGHGLQPPETATAVRIRGGKRQVQDGPFADTREHLGGYFVMNVASLDEALEWAARAPCAPTGGVEVWPVLPPPPGAPGA